MLRQDRGGAGGKTGFFPLITGLSWSFDWVTLRHHSMICFRELVKFISSALELCGSDQLSPHASIIIQWCDYHLSCWLSSNVMALRQSSELPLILGAGCRRAGDIKESDTSRKMNSEVLVPVCSLGLGGGRSACSAACTGWVICVCQQQSDGEWWSVHPHLYQPWLGDTQLEFLSQLIVFVSRRLFSYITTFQEYDLGKTPQAAVVTSAPVCLHFQRTLSEQVALPEVDVAIASAVRENACRAAVA